MRSFRDWSDNMSQSYCNAHGDQGSFKTFIDTQALFIGVILMLIVLDDHEHKQESLIVSSHSLLANWQIDLEWCQKACPVTNKSVLRVSQATEIKERDRKSYASCQTCSCNVDPPYTPLSCTKTCACNGDPPYTPLSCTKIGVYRVYIIFLFLL